MITSSNAFEAWIDLPGPIPLEWQLPLGQGVPQFPAAKKHAAPRTNHLADLAMDGMVHVVHFMAWIGSDSGEAVAVVCKVRGTVQAALFEYCLEHGNGTTRVWDAEEGIVKQLGLRGGDENIRGAHRTVTRDWRASGRRPVGRIVATDDRIDLSINSFIKDSNDDVLTSESFEPRFARRPVTYGFDSIVADGRRMQQSA